MSTYTVLKAEFDINGTKSSRAGRQDMLFCCSQKVRNKAERSHITLNAIQYTSIQYTRKLQFLCRQIKNNSVLLLGFPFLPFYGDAN